MSDALEIKLPDHGYIQLSVADARFMYAQLGELFDGQWRSVSDTTEDDGQRKLKHPPVFDTSGPYWTRVADSDCHQEKALSHE